VEDGVLLVITSKNFEREMEASLLGNFVRALAGRFREIDRRASAHARRLLDATLFSHILTYLNFRGSDVEGRRIAAWSPLIDYLCKVDPRSREELLQVVTRMSSIAVDPSSDRITLSKPLGFHF
jgi:hypothetical protein